MTEDVSRETSELDLDALDRNEGDHPIVSLLIAELRACLANLNDFVDATTYYRERAERAEAELALGREISNAAVAEAEERADRAEAERDAAIQSGWFQAERAERAEAKLQNLQAQSVIDCDAALAEIAVLKARIAATLACISDWAAIPPSVRIVRIERALTGGDAHTL